MTWAICCLSESSLLAAATAQIKHTPIALWISTLVTLGIFGFQGRVKGFVRVPQLFLQLILGQALHGAIYFLQSPLASTTTILLAPFPRSWPDVRLADPMESR